MRELARQRTVEAIKTLTAVMRSGRTEQARVRAAEALLNGRLGPTHPVYGTLRPHGPSGRWAGARDRRG